MKGDNYINPLNAMILGLLLLAGLVFNQLANHPTTTTTTVEYSTSTTLQDVETTSTLTFGKSYDEMRADSQWIIDIINHGQFHLKNGRGYLFGSDVTTTDSVYAHNSVIHVDTTDLLYFSDGTNILGH